MRRRSSSASRSTRPLCKTRRCVKTSHSTGNLETPSTGRRGENTPYYCRGSSLEAPDTAEAHHQEGRPVHLRHRDHHRQEPQPAAAASTPAWSCHALDPREEAHLASWIYAIVEILILIGALVRGAAAVPVRPLSLFAMARRYLT